MCVCVCLCVYAPIYVYSHIRIWPQGRGIDYPPKHLDISKGAPLRLPTPLSDQFPVRVCSCACCISTICVCVNRYVPAVRGRPLRRSRTGVAKGRQGQCIYIYIYIYIYISVCLCVCVHLYMYVRTYAYVYVYMKEGWEEGAFV